MSMARRRADQWRIHAVKENCPIAQERNARMSRVPVQRPFRAALGENGDIGITDVPGAPSLSGSCIAVLPDGLKPASCKIAKRAKFVGSVSGAESHTGSERRTVQSRGGRSASGARERGNAPPKSAHGLLGFRVISIREKRIAGIDHRGGRTVICLQENSPCRFQRSPCGRLRHSRPGTE